MDMDLEPKIMEQPSSGFDYSKILVIKQLFEGPLLSQNAQEFNNGQFFFAKWTLPAKKESQTYIKLVYEH